MKRLAPAMLLMAAVGAYVLSSTTTVSATYVLPLTITSAVQATNAHLSGDHEVPARDTRAQGQVALRVSRDGTTVSYTLMATNIENVVAAHIHLGQPSENGPVVVFLYGPAAPGGGRQTGVLSDGSFTSANFVGPLAGDPMSDLINAIAAGNAYVNVHTNDGVAPIDTGPGDFPGGEIRGQLRAR